MQTFARRWGLGPPFVLLFALIVGASPARAQWAENGLHLTSSASQRLRRVIGDGSGGAFLMLLDEANSNFTGWDLRVLHLDVSGQAAPGWTLEGQLVGVTTADELGRGICTQADATLTLAFTRGAPLMTGRLRQDGSIPSGWEPGAVRVSSRFTAGGRVCPTPDNGNFFLWQSGAGPGGIAMLQRFSAVGQVASGWPVDGATVASNAGFDYLYLDAGPVPDGADGVWFGYYAGPPTDPRGTESDVYLQHVDGLGAPMPGFPYGGLSVCSAPGVQAQPTICRDGNDGVFVAWCDARSCPGTPDPDLQYCYDVYLQRFTGDGTVAPGWPANGLPVCVDPLVQQAPKVVPDGSGGVYVAWEIAGAQGWGIHAQHVLADGSIAPGWPAGGKRMFGDDVYGDNMAVCSDQQGGLFVAGSLYMPVGGFRVYVQHVTANGQFDGAWGAAGLPMVSPQLNQSEDDVELAESLPGSVIVAWEGLAGEAYAARVTLDGVVATSVALVSQEASAERVVLSWSVGGEPLADAAVERRSGSEPWRALASVAADGTGMLRYEDRDIVPGARYAYRLAWTEGGVRRHSGEAWVTVPAAARFALAGATPNPAPRGELRVAFSLAEAGEAQLALYDAQGRVVARHELGTPQPGAHVEPFAQARTLRPGLYWLRLTQGAREATARVVLVE